MFLKLPVKIRSNKEFPNRQQKYIEIIAVREVTEPSRQRICDQLELKLNSGSATRYLNFIKLLNF